VDKAFESQIGRNVEVYVDDMLIKSKEDDSLIRDTEETLIQLAKINMKLNPKKCSFGMQKGKFLGHVVTLSGIEANPEKIKAIMEMGTPRTVKDVQSLNGKLAALGRFLAKSAEKSIPFYKALKGHTKSGEIVWSEEAEQALAKLKEHLHSLPTMASPIKEEALVMYLSANQGAISAVLLAEREGKQIPVYFISRTLQGAELNYSQVEKLILSLIYAIRKLR
jgi:RNase H-like domain found in reverse transcriptase/Reverse transcriptase (RNA-dependent DNA polymerase)